MTAHNRSLATSSQHQFRCYLVWPPRPPQCSGVRLIVAHSALMAPQLPTVHWCPPDCCPQCTALRIAAVHSPLLVSLRQPAASPAWPVAGDVNNGHQAFTTFYEYRNKDAGPRAGPELDTSRVCGRRASSPSEESVAKAGPLS